MSYIESDRVFATNVIESFGLKVWDRAHSPESEANKNENQFIFEHADYGAVILQNISMTYERIVIQFVDQYQTFHDVEIRISGVSERTW